ncbi:MAG: phasin family protein [Rhodobacteraceae bacterium]|nr:phasin family protein [Paracoccaceae bacterium]MCY4251573.1 phasin family protein [Paracoccaceae bacterium]MCY4309498.1 phasin family protein [Paracoccaceae bacterium]
MTENHTLTQITENMDKTADLNKNIVNISLTLAENNVEYSRKLNQELVDGWMKLVSEFKNPEQFSKTMFNIVSASGETTTNYFMNSADLIKNAQKEALDIFLAKSEMETSPEVETSDSKAPAKKVKKVARETPVISN